MEDLNVVIVGAAGEGVQTVGDILAHTISAQGYAVFAWQEYESRIRGGQNSYSIRITEKPEPLIKEEGTLIGQNHLKERMIAIPFSEIAEDELKNKIYTNTIAVRDCGVQPVCRRTGLQESHAGVQGHVPLEASTAERTILLELRKRGDSPGSGLCRLPLHCCLPHDSFNGDHYLFQRARGSPGGIRRTGGR